MNNKITIDLKSNSISSKTITLLISTSILIFVIWLIITKGIEIFNNSDISPKVTFSYVILSIMGVTFPSVLNFAILKTILIKDICIIDQDVKEISVNKINTLKKSSEIIQKFNIEKITEIIYIRINEDEDGIINNYHIFKVSNNDTFEKIYTFQKFHYALRFINHLKDKTDFLCLDWTDYNFEKESDFVDFYKNRN